MTRPYVSNVSNALTDDQGSFSGNFLAQGNASDPDGTTVKVAGVDGKFVAGSQASAAKGALNSFVGDYGTLTIYEDGSYTYTLKDGLGLGPNDSITENFNVKISDGNKEYWQSKLVFTINGTTNDAPVAVNDTATTNAAGFASGNVLANDYDPDGDAIIVGAAYNPAYHAVAGAGVVNIEGVYGTLTIDSTGTYSYNVNYADVDTIAAGSSTVVEHFTYKSYDSQVGEGHNTGFAKLDITIDLALV